MNCTCSKHGILRKTQRLLVGGQEQETDADGVIILKYFLSNYGVNIWNGFIWFMIGTGGGSCEHGIELADFMKISEFIDLLGECPFLSSVDLMKDLNKKKHEEETWMRYLPVSEAAR